MKREIEPVTIEAPGQIVVLDEFAPGQWAATMWPGWTTFADTPEAAFADLLRRYPREWGEGLLRRGRG